MLSYERRGATGRGHWDEKKGRRTAAPALRRFRDHPTEATALFLCVLASMGAAAHSAAATPEPLSDVCSVRDHGATGTRTQNATAPVQKAIDACHARGGGTAYVPPGEYTTGTIILKDNVTLWLEAGAVFYLSQDEADFPRERAFVYAEGARNIAIRGRGRFDGQARYEWGPPEDEDTEILEEALASPRGRGSTCAAGCGAGSRP